jgi:hypothetical protein
MAHSDCSKSYAGHVLQQNGLVLDHSMPIGMMINGQYYCTLLQYKLRLALYHKQPELLEHGVIFLLDNATPHCYCDVQNVVQHLEWKVLAHSS